MSTCNELEMLLRRGITLLHSPHSNSAIDLRKLLDEEIRKRYGTERMISNTMTKRQFEKEINFPGRIVTPPPQQATEEIINLTNSPAKTISDSPNTIIDSDDAASVTGDLLTTSSVDVETNLKEFGDLNCCVCGEIMFTATNRLIECSKCGALYHQECHKPPIKDNEAVEDQAHNWQCDTCMKKPNKISTVIIIPDDPMLPVLPDATPIHKTKSSLTSSGSPSSSSNSSSSLYKTDPNTISKPITKLTRDPCNPSGSKTNISKKYSSSTSSTSSSSLTTSMKLKPSKHHDKRKSNK